MKKILTILMLVAVLSLLVGCGAKKTKEAAELPKAPATAEEVEATAIEEDIAEISDLDIESDLAELDDLDKELENLI